MHLQTSPRSRRGAGGGAASDDGGGGGGLGDVLSPICLYEVRFIPRYFQRDKYAKFSQ